jgi:hypothetical protein
MNNLPREQSSPLGANHVVLNWPQWRSPTRRRLEVGATYLSTSHSVSGMVMEQRRRSEMAWSQFYESVAAIIYRQKLIWANLSS